MANANIAIRMGEELKKQADALFDEMGMSFITAVNIFVKQALREKRIPFEVTATQGVFCASAEMFSGPDMERRDL